MYFTSPSVMPHVASRLMRMFVRQTEAHVKIGNRLGVCYTFWTLSMIHGMRSFYQSYTPRF